MRAIVITHELTKSSHRPQVIVVDVSISHIMRTVFVMTTLALSMIILAPHVAMGDATASMMKNVVYNRTLPHGRQAGRCHLSWMYGPYTYNKR